MWQSKMSRSTGWHSPAVPPFASASQPGENTSEHPSGKCGAVCGTRCRGRERVGEAFARVFKIFPDAKFGDAHHFVAGNRGVSEWIFSGTTADGKKVEVNGCDIFTFQSGKIAVKSSYFKNRTA